jgi:LacI family transcriptional regulator
MEQLAEWIQKLPKPVGIISVCDSRARHLLQICEKLGIIVPNEVSIIGIDNDEIARCLSRVSLSSVGQNCKQIGYQSAKILHRLLDSTEFNKNSLLKITKFLIQPTKVFERQSTDFRSLNDPYVIQAIHYISHNAYKKIRVDQVLENVGISRTNLEVRFRNILGHSIHQEIYNAKLKRACNLLTATSLPLTEISDMCGYTSLQYMYNVFKKNLSRTPKEYREGMR